MTPGWLLLIAGGGLVAGIFSAFKSPRVWLAATLAGAVAAFAAAVWMLATGVVWDWQPDFVIGGEAAASATRRHQRIFSDFAFRARRRGNFVFQRILVRQKSSGLRAAGPRVVERAAAQHGLRAAVRERPALPHRLGNLHRLRLFSHHRANASAPKRAPPAGFISPRRMWR